MMTNMPLFDATCIYCGKVYKNHLYNSTQFCSVGCQVDNFSDDSTVFHSQVVVKDSTRAQRILTVYNPVTPGMVRLQVDRSYVEVSKDSLFRLLEMAESNLTLLDCFGAMDSEHFKLLKDLNFIKGVLE